ncbi:MAG: ACT domain-containing protein [Acidimicrobiia bacterium]
MRTERERVVADTSLRGAGFGAALADACDAAVVEAASTLSLKGSWAVIAQGSYARRELCPGSDLDLVLVHSGGARGAAGDAAARALWYPFWDAGFTLGQATRTPKEALSLADEDLDALTALLDFRVVAGDADFAHDLRDKGRALAAKRRSRMIDALASGSNARYERPGPVAEMLEPNVKDGAGGLRDLHALTWAGWAVSPLGGLAGLIAVGVVAPADVEDLEAANTRLLDVRVGLHRVTGGRSDQLTLQEQDAVARLLDISDADALLRELADAARQVGWISREVWSRLESGKRGPSGRIALRDRPLDHGVVLREGRVTLLADEPITVTSTLRVAAAAAEQDAAIGRATLARLGEVDGEIPWGSEDRTAFFRLLRAGRPLVAVFEALDHVGALVRLLPEWAHVRARPQRNAYHRFTVDRHLLEAVVECDTLLDEAGGAADIARRARVELLLFGALTHDIAKGAPGDHSEVGAVRAAAFATRIGLEEHAAVVISWLVHNHLLMADTATRRDLADAETIIRFGRLVHDTERLDLLYALTIADSRATGPAAWSSGKAALCRQLFVETDALLEDGVVDPRLAKERQAVLERHRALLDTGELAVEWTERDDGLRECTVVARDRRGLLATVAGVLTLVGFDIQGASGYGDPDTGMALEVYRGIDRFGRLEEAGQRDFVTMLRSALDGALPLRARLSERIRRYRSPAPATDRSVDVRVDVDASASATVIEVHAPDDVGLLASVAAVFADLGIDVSVALVSTTGLRAVDVFYIRDAQGAKPTDPMLLQRIRATLIARLTTEYVLPAPR